MSDSPSKSNGGLVGPLNVKELNPAFLQLVKVSPQFASTLLSALAARLRFLTTHLN